MLKVSALAVAFLALGALAQAPHDHQHSFEDAGRWAGVFDDPKRDEWQKPHEVIQALALAPDALVADIGAGTGYFAVRLARMLPKGKVYAADVEPQMVRHLAARAKRDELANMHAVQSDFDDARLPERVDLVLFVDVVHHIDGRESYFRRLKQSLKAGGRVAIVDFRPDSEIGPPPRARISAAHVKRQLAAAGFALAAEHEFLPNQYFLVFKPD
jgi:SAM-dependent methyltransferase